MLDGPPGASGHQTDFQTFASRYVRVEGSPESDPELARLETALRVAEMCVLPSRTAVSLLCYLDVARRSMESGEFPPVTDISSRPQVYEDHGMTLLAGEYRRQVDHLIDVIWSATARFPGGDEQARWVPVYEQFEDAIHKRRLAAEEYAEAKGDERLADRYPRTARTALRLGLEGNARALVEASTALRVAVDEKWGMRVSRDPAAMRRLAMQDLAVADPPGLVAITSGSVGIAEKIAKRENPALPSSLRDIYVITDSGEIRLSPKLHPALEETPFFKRTGNCIAWGLYEVPTVYRPTAQWLCETAIESGWGPGKFSSMSQQKGILLDRTSTSTIGLMLATDAASQTSWRVDLGKPMMEVVDRQAGVAR